MTTSTITCSPRISCSPAYISSNLYPLPSASSHINSRSRLTTCLQVSFGRPLGFLPSIFISIHLLTQLPSSLLLHVSKPPQSPQFYGILNHHKTQLLSRFLHRYPLLLWTMQFSNHPIFHVLQSSLVFSHQGPRFTTIQKTASNTRRIQPTLYLSDTLLLHSSGTIVMKFSHALLTLFVTARSAPPSSPNILPR